MTHKETASTTAMAESRPMDIHKMWGERAGDPVPLSDDWVEKLKALPESGMGYQEVDFDLSGGQTIHGVVVLNCSEVISHPDLPIEEIVGVRLAED